jgi:DNA end-binding protein Ku
MVALGRIVLAKRERVIMLQPWDKGLVGTTLRYPYELRDTKDYFDDIPDVTVPKEMLQLAEHILDTKKADFDPGEFVDRYEEAVVAMLKQKQAGLPMPKETAAPAPTNVVNLMDALRRSISEGKRAPAESQRERGKEATSRATQRRTATPKPAAKKHAGRGGAKQKKAG